MFFKQIWCTVKYAIFGMRSGFYLYEIFLKYLRDFSQWVFPLMFMRFFSNCEIFILCLWDFSQIWRFSSNCEINLINQWGNQTLGGVHEELLQYLQDLLYHMLLWDISCIAMVFCCQAKFQSSRLVQPNWVQP